MKYHASSSSNLMMYVKQSYHTYMYHALRDKNEYINFQGAEKKLANAGLK